MKAPALFRLLVLLVLLSILFAFPRKILANEDVILDDFTILNGNHWNIDSNPGGVVEINADNNLKLSSPNGRFFPYVYLKNIQIPENNFTVELKFKFTGNLNYGNGIIFSDKLLVNGNHQDVSAADVIFQIWPTSGSTIGVWTTLCDKNSIGCTNGSYRQLGSVPTETWHVIKIVENNGYYSITVDGNTSETKDSTRKISQIWIGNPQTTNTSVNWASILLDDFHIYKNQSESKVPVIVIPGFGASWDVGALLSGTSGNNWKIPEQVTVYNGLINSLKNAGYVDGDNLFVFSYDWRKPLDNLADDLKAYILSKGLQDKKINIISHSMGGLVARSYAQKYGVDKINKITTSGSPHMGVLDAYGLWEGATFWDDIWWEKTLIEVSTEANQIPGETKVETLRRISPSIKDVLPTADFLKLNGTMLPWNSLKQKNTYLSDLNANTAALDQIIIPFWSSDQQTRSTINAIKPTGFDTLWKKWEDGKPATTNPFSFSTGDGTVTQQSATGPFTHSVQASGSHVDLMTKNENIKAILNSLSIDSTSSVGVSPDNRRDAFVAMLRSPGKLKVCNEANVCDAQLGIYLPDNKLFILPGYADEKLTVQVVADGLGEYGLHLGNLADEGQWETVIGNLQSSGQIDTYSVQGESMQVTSDEDTGDRSLLAAKARLRIYSPNWDRLGLAEKLSNNRVDAKSRLLFANLLRLSLKDELDKARRVNNSQYLEKIIDVWNAIDQVTEKILIEKKFYRLGGFRLLGNRFWFFNEWFVRHQFESDKYRSYFSTVLIDLASDRYNEAKETPSNYPSLKADRILQAEILTQFAREIR